MSTTNDASELWTYEDPGPIVVTSDAQIHFRLTHYNGFGTKSDGSRWSTNGRPLADGSWFEIHHWSPR